MVIKLSGNQLRNYNSADIIENLKTLSYDLDLKYLDFELVEQKILDGFSNKMDIDKFITYQAETLAYLNL